MKSNAKSPMQQRLRYNIYTKNETWQIMLHKDQLKTFVLRQNS